MSLKYLGPFEDWEIAIAKKLVNDLLEEHSSEQHPRFKGHEFDDLLEECLTHWYFVRERYDAERQASKKTFMGRVIRNKLKDLVQERQADKRKLTYLAESLDKPVGEDEESPTLGDEVVDEVAHKPFAKAELDADLSKALEKLTPEQRCLSELLAGGLTVVGVSERLKIPRSTIYDEIKRIRAVFLKEGLRDYLE